MKKTAIIGAAAILAASFGTALASPHSTKMYTHRSAYTARTAASSAGAYRCHGMSYGTGAQSCGTATGGPAGGITSRN